MSDYIKSKLFRKYIIPLIPTFVVVFLVFFFLLIIISAFSASEANENTEGGNTSWSNVENESKLLLPYKSGEYVISCDLYCYSGHKGIDYVGTNGKNVYAGGNGTIYSVSESCNYVGYIGNQCGGGYGNYIIVLYVIDGISYYVTYAHFSDINSDLSTGNKVNVNTLLGVEGSTGNSTGSHVHIDVRTRSYSAESLADSHTVIKEIFIER